jgi:3-oxoacyl-(acyl-carrier-protein) synthase
MREPRRVVVTGLGAVTPIGTGADGLWRGLRERRSAVQCVTRFDPTPFKSRIAAQVNDFVPTDHMGNAGPGGWTGSVTSASRPRGSRSTTPA